MQISLFEHVENALSKGLTSTSDIYANVANNSGTDMDSNIELVGQKKQPINTFKRKIRWHMQTLKHDGLIENIQRGQWRITRSGKEKLAQIHCDRFLVAANTDLGAVIWGDSLHVFDHVITEDISLLFGSPPYLDIQRSYGTYQNEDAYIDFILSVVGKIRKRLIKGANVCLNFTNDSFLKRAFGQRSMYLEKLTLRLAQELDLYLMDRLVWHVPNKLPNPKPYIVDNKTHLVPKYEPLLWFCTSPQFCIANNSNSRTPYSDAMRKTIDQGGEKKSRKTRDNGHRINKGKFAKDNGGAIQGNVITLGNTCQYNRAIIDRADKLGLPSHSATFPLALADLIINWLCPEGHLLVDPWGGYSTVGRSAEALNRRWYTVELHWEYIKPSLLGFEHCENYYLNPMFNALSDTLTRFGLAGA